MTTSSQTCRTGWPRTGPGPRRTGSLTTSGPRSPTHAAFASDPAVVSDQYLRLAAPVAITAGDKLSFWHSRGLESTFDGGVVEVSTNGGSTWADIGAAAFTSNGYNATISTCCANPIGGRQAFSGTSPYVKSVASLAAYAGQNVLIRFRTGTDSSVERQPGGPSTTSTSATRSLPRITSPRRPPGIRAQTQDVTTQIVAADCGDEARGSPR